jgi:transposase
VHYAGIDLHKRFLVVGIEDDEGRVERPVRLACRDVARIVSFFKAHRPFRCVIEASSSYRWLYELLSPLGEVQLAHPYRLRAIVAGRAKTDKLDAALLAKLLRAGLIPLAHIPARPYSDLRDLTRSRARVVRLMVRAKNELHAILARSNTQIPYANIFCKSGRRWIAGVDFGWAGNVARDELLERLDHFENAVRRYDDRLAELEDSFPQVEALTDIHGIGLYSALLIIGEVAEPGRFRNGRQVGAYAGLTARVSQSGASCHYGHITRQGSGWLRWILVQVAMQAVRRDAKLRRFYERIRKRSSAKIARVAVARKLATICWLRLVRWERCSTVA